MSDKASSCDSSDFSDGYPTTTTISTVALQAGNARIVLAVLRCGSWIRVRIQRMEPDLYDIGGNADEARSLHEIHQHLCTKLASKQEQISELLSKADDLVTQQTSDNQSQVYAAMAESLNRAWRDLLGILTQRGRLLDLAMECFNSAENVIQQAERVEHLCITGSWGHDVSSVRQLIEEHENLKRTGLLEPSHNLLNSANNLLELLGRMSSQTGSSTSTSNTGPRHASIEARDRVAAITSKAGMTRKHAEDVWNRRDHLLQLRLTVVSMEAELERIVDWFVKIGEPRFSDIQVGTSLSECQTNLDRLMTLTDEVRDLQNAHSHLTQNLHQATTTDSWRRKREKSVSEILRVQEQELGIHSTSLSMDIDNENELNTIHDSDTWRVTHGAYSELITRLRTTESYIWEFLDRIENRRRQLHTSVIYYSEINVLLSQIYQLESDMKRTRDLQQTGLEEIYYNKLTDIEVRVPGLKQTMNELRTNYNEKIRTSNLRSQLGVTTQSYLDELDLTSTAAASVTGKMREVDEGITRCRDLLNQHKELNIKIQKREETEFRLNELSMWLSQRIHRSLVEYGRYGTTVEQVADFGDVHRRLQRELQSREPDLEELRIAIGRLSPPAGRSSAQDRLNELSSCWTRYRQIIQLRLELANQFSSLLKSIRENDVHFNSIIQKMNEADKITTSSDFHPSWIQVGTGDTQQIAERIRRELNITTSSLEEEQIVIRQFINHITQRADQDLQINETIHFCQVQIELNNKRLNQLRDSWDNCQQLWDQYKLAQEQWNIFTQTAHRLDESITSSLSRMSRTPLPSQPHELSEVLRVHHNERNEIDHLTLNLKTVAQQLGSMIGAQPDDHDHNGQSWRFIEVPNKFTTGLPLSSMGKRLRSEMCIQLAGLETRWKAWDKAWTLRSIQLERRSTHFGQLTTIEEIEAEIVSAERKLQQIMGMVSLTTPLSQVQMADKDLSQIEATIPVLHSRIRSSAPDMKLQLIQGEPTPTEYTGTNIDLLNVSKRHEQLEIRLTTFTEETVRCRTEINLTLRLLNAVDTAQKALSQITFNLNRVKNQLPEITSENRYQIEEIRFDISEQINRGRVLADTHIPILEQLSIQYPRPMEAKQFIQPIVNEFQSSINNLTQLSDEIRVRTEQCINLQRLQPTHIYDDQIKATTVKMPTKAKPPIIIKPLENITIEEGKKIIMETIFDSGLPPDANPYDTNQLQVTWYKDGIPVVTPDYEVNLTENTASLKISETLNEDNAIFTCYISTPYGKAETKCTLTIIDTKSPIPINESLVQPTKNVKEQKPIRELGDPPEFIKHLKSTCIDETNELVLDCQAVGLPVPFLSWYRNGQLIDQNPDFKITQLAGSGILRIPQCRMMNHSGLYLCRATNPYGECSTTCQVDIKPARPPVIIQPLQNVNLKVGDRCKLTVQYKSELPVEVEWYHNDVPIQGEVGRRRITMELNNMVSLHLLMASDLEDGKYTCTVRNAAGSATTYCNVTVQPTDARESLLPSQVTLRPTAPRRRRDLQSDVDEVFEPVKIPRIVQSPTRVTEERVIPVSAVKGAYPYTSPKYSQRAVSVPPTTTASVPLRIQTNVRGSRPVSDYGRPPQFILPLQNAGVNETEKIKLECQITGIPEPKVTWLKNGIPLAKSNSYTIKEIGQYHCLIFYDVFLDDQGEYTCVAENPYGQAFSSCRMDVEPICADEQPTDSEPTLVKPLPPSLSVVEGGSVELTCQFTGRPLPSIVWLKDGKQPQSSTNFQTFQDSGFARLYIPKVEKDRTGIYEAVATNPLGSCSTTVYMEILPSIRTSIDLLPTISPVMSGSSPEFTRIFKDVYIESERLEEVVLECSVVGVPTPVVYWTHNGIIIRPDDQRYAIGQGPGPNDHCLIIRRPGPESSGRYQAIAENLHGRVTCSALISPIGYSQTIIKRPPSTMSLTRHTVTRQICPRETSLPPSPASTAPIISPQSLATVQLSLSPVRFQRETSAPPSQYYLTRHHLQIRPRQPTPPIQLTFALPRKEQSLSRTEIIRPVESQLKLQGQVKHYSSTQHLYKKQITPIVPTIETRYSRRVASQPRLSPGYSSEEEHEHSMSVVPMVRHYKTRMERNLVTRPYIMSGYSSVKEHKRTLHITPMRREYQTSLEHNLPARPTLEKGYAAEEEREYEMNVVPIVPHTDYKTELTTDIYSKPEVTSGYTTETEHIRSFEVTPMVPEYHTKMERQIASHPILEAGYSSEEEHEHKLDIIPMTTSYKTELNTDISSKPELMPGYAVETKHPIKLEVTPIVPEYRTELDTKVASHPHLEEGYTSEGEHEHQMELIPLVPEYKTQLSTDLSAKTEVISGYESRLHYEKTYLMETQLKQYETAISTHLPSRPSLTSIFESTFEHETNMNVVPVVPQIEHHKSQWITDFYARYRPVDVIVEVPIPPEFVRPLANVVADEGACVVIEGLVNGTPQPKISWYRSGRQLSDGPDFRLDYTNNRVRLTLSEAFPDDAGEYTCEAENIAGRAQSTANLIVRGRLMTPRFIKGLENQVIYERESVRLIVKVDGYPPPTVTWTRDGHEITSSPNYILECEGDGIYALNIPEAFFENSGRYAVIAENPAGKCISSGLLTVLEPERPYPRELDKLCLSQLTVQVEGLKQVHIPSPEPKPYPEKPYFTKTFSPEIEIYEGERLVLTAEACGNPIPFIKWYLNGQPLVDSPDHQQTQVGPPVSDVNELQPHPVIMTGHLIMNELFPEDSGLYTCIAENMAGQAEIMANISVIPKTISDTKKPTIQPPEFIKFPDSPVRVQPDQELILEVEVKGLPLNSLNWYHNGMIVYNNPNQFIQNIPNTGITRLIIQRIQPDDQGEWIVTATNPAGSCSKCLQIIREEPISVLPEPVVHTEYEWKLSHPSMDITDLSHTYQQQTIFIQPEMIPPNFIERFPSELKINEKIPLHINSRVYGQPKPSVQWLKNGKPLYSDERIHYHVLDNGEVRLEITEPTEADSGIYVASAKNPAGEDHCIVNLSVVPLSSVAPTGQPPVFCRGPLPWSPTEAGPIITCPGVLHLQEGQPIRLEAEVIGKPSPVVSWFINGRPITMDKTHKIIPMRANVCSLILDTPVPNIDSGVCSCIATNQFGQAELRFNIHVESKPQAISQAPRFIQKPPTQLTVPLNEEVTLYAVAEGIPQPVLSWHKDGKLFTGTSDGRIQILTNELETTLHIVALQSEDLSTWQCLAANIAGTASARAKISAPIEEKPKEIIRKFSIPKKQPEGLQEITSPNPIIMSPPQSVCINEGENARFTAHIVANPSPIVTWYVNGQPVPSYGVIQAQQPESEEIRYISRFDGLIYYLDMQKCRPEDAGEIVVVAQRSDISPELVNIEPNAVVSASAKLEVIPVIDLRAQLKPIPKPSVEVMPEKVMPIQEGPAMRAPRFLKFLQPQTVPESSEIMFSVEFDGEPAPEVTWTREQVDISNKENYKITTTSTTSQLVISKVLLEDTGNFSVTLRNPAGQACSKSRLTVTQIKVSGKAPEFIPPLIESQIVEAGEPITFECKVTGEPTPQVHWERNGERLPLKDLEHIHVFDAPPFHTLVLCETVPDDSAEYRCVAINAHGQSTCKANVTIQAKSAAIVPPRIIQEPKSVTVMESQPVQLIALIEGIPMPEITWLFNNEIIKPSRYFLPEVRSDGYTILNISSVYPEDTGIYTVRAVNSGGEAQASVEVSISAPLQTAPQFVKPLPTERIEVKEGERVFLEVEVSGEPMPQIDWYLNGQSLQSVSNWKIKTDRYTSQIECNVISMTDGEILVRATNSVGQTTTQTKVVIIQSGPKPTPPVFQKRLQPQVKTPEHHTVTLVCSVNGYPEPTLRWFHNGVEFEPVLISSLSHEMTAKRELYIDEATHTYTLHIHDLNAFDVGEIMVRAENELGVTMCSSVLELEIIDGKIVEPRFIRQPPERIELQPGDSAQLECEVESQPPVTFKWYLNGLQLDQSNKRFKLLEDINRTTLIIPSVQKDILPSEVTIEAAGQTGTKIVTSSILVMTAKTDDLSIPEPPELRFTRQLPSNLSYGEMDETIILDVEIDKPEISSIELPKPTFSWYMNGIDIFLLPPEKKPERYNVTQDNPWHSRLTINKPGTLDSGEITCFVTRLTGTKEEKIYTSCNLELTYQPIQPEEPSKPIISKLEFAPQFIQGLPEKLTPEVGSTVVMDIIVKSNPIPDIQWVISSPITAERFEYFGPEQIDDVTLQYRAILHNYQPDKDDNTMLQIIATSPLGQSTSICHIQPKEQPEIVNVQFAKTLNSQLEVVLDQPIELECSIIPTNIPIEFRWFIKDLEITSEHKPYEIITTDYISILKIPKITTELIDSTIQVLVVYPYGELKSSCELYTIFESHLPMIEDVITELPTIPEMLTIQSKLIEHEYEFHFIKPIHYEIQQHSNDEYTLELECQLITDQQPASIKWSHEGVELNISDRIEQVYEYESGLAKLIIHNITPQDMGEYTCIATKVQLQPSQVEPIQKTITTSTVVDIEVPETTEVVPTVTEKVLTFLQPVTPNIHTVQDHKDLELECQIQADLKPIEVVWEVDGKELTQSDRNEMIYFEDSGIARLIVHQVIPSDSGEYTCRVQGEVVEAETKQQMTKTISSGSIVTIEVPETTEVVPTVTEKVLTFLQPVTPNIHTVQDHKDLELECQIQADLKPIEVVWEVDGKELTQSDRNEMIYFEDSGIARLIVHQVIPSDSGEYTCRVQGEVVEAETKQQMTKTISSGSIVTIEVPETTEVVPTVTEKVLTFLQPVTPNIHTVQDHKDLELECQIQADLKPIEVVWEVDGKELTQSDRNEMIYFEDSGIARLIVHQVIPSDSGEYTCRVQGEVVEAETKQQMTKTISSGSIVTIEVPETTEVVPTVTEKVLTFLQPVTPNIHTVQDHKDLELECQIQADLKPIEVVWEVDGKELTQSDRNEMIYFEDSGIARLIVHQVIPSDSGEYTCRVQGEVVEAETKQQMTKTISSGSIVTIEVPETTEVVPTVTEKVLTFLQPVTPNIHTVQDHKDLELECQIQADLKPIEVVWEVDGKELTQSDRNEMIYFEDSGIARLIVHQVIPSDSGEYTCRVQGEVVEAETKQQMTKTISSGSIVTIEAVEKEDNLASPIFVQELTPLNISEGDEIYLTATVKGNPQPVEVIWKHNGNILQPDVTDAVIFYTPETGVCELTISEAFPEDSGIYSVEVQNTLGMAVSQTEVVVLVEVRKEQIVLKSEDQKASIVEDILTVVTDISDDKAVVSTVESVELLKQEVIVNIVQTEKTEMFSPIETLQEIPQAAIYEHIIEETEYEISLEEPLEISDDELLLDEGVTPTHVVVLDVLIPHDSVSIDETSISVEEAGRALSIPSVTEISLHDVSLAAVSDVNVTELKPIDANVLTQEEKQKLPEKEYQIQSNDITGEETSDKQMKNEIQAEQTEMTEVSTKNELEKNKTTKIEEECQAMKKFETDEKQTEKVTYKKITLKETLVEKEKVPVSIVSKGVVEVTDVKSTVGVAEESGSVAEQETLVVEQVAESKETVTVKMEERIVQEVEKESVPETMEWVSEGVDVNLIPPLDFVSPNADT
uniref:Nesprin-1 n=1 Tax=Schistosoma mansoni TaxID=6183 RepID=A0A5K4FFR8_SCHMA